MAQWSLHTNYVKTAKVQKVGRKQHPQGRASSCPRAARFTDTSGRLTHHQSLVNAACITPGRAKGVGMFVSHLLIMYGETIWATHPELRETRASGLSRPRGANRKTCLIAGPHLQTLFIKRNTFSGAFTNNRSRSSRLENVLHGEGAPEEGKKNISSPSASSALRIRSDLITKQSKMHQNLFAEDKNSTLRCHEATQTAVNVQRYADDF